MSDESFIPPAQFAREDLGLTLWRGQEDVLRAAVEVPRLAVVSGHKTGMTLAAAVLATWFYSTRTGVRISLVSRNTLLVNDVLNKLPRHVNGNRIEHVEAHRADRFFAPPKDAWLFREMLVVIDNAEDVPDVTLRAIDGFAATGAGVVMFGHAFADPGTFWSEIRRGEHAARWVTMRLSSEDTPNATSGEKVIRGLATRAWIEERRREWGPDYASHPLYRSRVLGLFPIESDHAA